MLVVGCVTELALLRVDDVLYPSGAIREEVYLRAEITKGCRPRNIHLTHEKCIAAINAWLDVRQYRGWGLSGDSAYRGFLPHTKLVLTHKGRSFELAVKRRKLDSGLMEYRACDALQQTMSRLYRQAGIKLGSSHSGRRTPAARVLAATGDVETVQAVLGHQELDHTKPYLTVDQVTIRRAFEMAL
ncbi:tyrosine-type recombinase/integrase [Halomonas sp. McH1-25]|uniref:tyrosine-type recombinase/integrase n=1 Tax=unclassified Halomonas TaxID=2609666 RepID=UPI001EF53379|nr:MULTISPECIES: tyrosine-type recombinase/integrase [unclassified Halomonas]MCG7600080.1 tyrosine-type recombinase/integrase [Halomonas sp. McH1-25]MCP1344248.1 tyrosine-type recombinase/integrase [Halomonas sp. FL8]MCP1363164.1 tyrosine-type recombinase/integrase [Halomonas sp. BBD45]MCP1367708.1 tyrosine-type recombinase/integrase [Halomonas sp. BBD48]